MQRDIFAELMRKAHYALNSKSENLVYHTYGEAVMAADCAVITKEQMKELNELLIVNGLNNPRAGLE